MSSASIRVENGTGTPRSARICRMYSRLGSGFSYSSASRAWKGSARRIALDAGPGLRFLPASPFLPAAFSTAGCCAVGAADRRLDGAVSAGLLAAALPGFLLLLVIDNLLLELIMRGCCPDGGIGRRASFRY